MEQFSPNHQHLFINAKLRLPPTTQQAVAKWLRRVVKAVDMKVLAGPFVCECDDEGNEGVTGVIILSTSHCSIHVWTKAEVPYANIDLYSCKNFDIAQIEPLLSEFEPYHYEYMWVDRNATMVSTGPFTISAPKATGTFS